MSQLSPLVSIITPSYNTEKFIEQTINSVLNQAYDNFEFIIIDDKSTDSSLEIISKYAKSDTRIKVIKNDVNLGAAGSRNIGIDVSEGKYIAFIDSDDIWFQGKLEKQIKFMEDYGYNFSFSGYQLINENGEPTKKYVEVPKSIDYHELLKNTIIGCLTVIINKQIIGDVRMISMKSAEEYSLWFALGKKGVIFHGYNEILGQYRVRANSISSNKIIAAKEVWKLYRKYENLNFIYSGWCLMNYAYNALFKYKSYK